jgi:hypothetical protein
LSTVYFRIAARPAVTPARAPLLERLLARAEAPRHVIDWRADAFRALAPKVAEMPAVASAAARGVAVASSVHWALLASPLHFEAGLRDVVLPADGLLTLEPAEVEALAAGFNEIFATGGAQLVRGSDESLVCLFDAPIDVQTTDPENVIGRDVFEALPRGADAPRLRRLASEIEMWLFEHPVNAARRGRGTPLISSLWLWGGGVPGAALPAVEGWCAGSDPLFGAFPQESRYAPASGRAAARPGVVVIAHNPGTALWQRAEEAFIAPAVADLKARRLAAIELSAGERAFRLSARGLGRFWRSPRPWWETLAAEEAARDD